MYSGLGAALAAIVGLLAAPTMAQSPQTPEQAAEAQRLTALRDSLKPIRGVVAIPAAKATLALGDKYYFLGPDDARRVLTEGWNNPPSAVSDVLGMVFPDGADFLTDGAWGAVVTYADTKYVSDKDAKTADYDKVLADLRAGEDEQNAELQKQGFKPSTLIGWAQPPTYDPAHHDMIWARDVQFGDEADHTLNYDVRHLGRSGVLSMNLVSSMSHLGDVRPAAAELARTAEFDAGARYADFQKGDATAGYGLAGLVAAGVGLGVAKKAGLLAVALLFLKKGAVVFVAGFAAIAAWVRRTLGLKPKAGSPQGGPSEPPPSKIVE